MANFFKRLLDSLFVDKYNCIVCGEELEERSKYAICPICMDKLPFNTGHICEHCGKQMRDEAKYCLTCQNNKLEFDMCRSTFVYKNEAKELIYGIKFGGKKYLAKYMAMFYVDAYKKYGYNSDVVVSVPVSKKRRKDRGYNQSKEIALIVARELGLPYLDDVVIKTEELRPQEEFSGRERMENVLHAFKINDRESIKGKNVLLIDDVLTTGATISAVAHQLKKKCKRVDALVFASPEVIYHEEAGNLEEDYGLDM